jgi:hypothetical protein
MRIMTLCQCENVPQTSHLLPPRPRVELLLSQGHPLLRVNRPLPRGCRVNCRPTFAVARLPKLSEPKTASFREASRSAWGKCFVRGPRRMICHQRLVSFRCGKQSLVYCHHSLESLIFNHLRATSVIETAAVITPVMILLAKIRVKNAPAGRHAADCKTGSDLVRFRAVG